MRTAWELSLSPVGTGVSPPIPTNPKGWAAKEGCKKEKKGGQSFSKK
jgi:hypothetical protein